MKIFVCLKPVVNEDNIKIDSNGNIIRESLTLTVNKPDDYAIENAVILKKQLNLELIAITMGPQNSIDVLRYAISRGCDRAFLISDPKLKGSDCLITSKVLSSAIKKILGCEIDYAVFCGVSSDDAHTSMIPAQISYFLNIPFVYQAIECKFSYSKLVVLTSDAKITVSPPAVISFDISNIIKLSIAPLNLRIKAKTYNPSIITTQDIGLEISAKCSPTKVDSTFVKDINLKATEILDMKKEEDIYKIKKIIYE
ncbi:MAG: electron transfer flavoprotein subunit beta/FixA family protein [Elusimicrobiales bacterium]